MVLRLCESLPPLPLKSVDVRYIYDNDVLDRKENIGLSALHVHRLGRHLNKIKARLPYMTLYLIYERGEKLVLLTIVINRRSTVIGV